MVNKTYEIEELFFSPYAFKSKDTRGRVVPLVESEIRTPFQRDRDRIIHSKSFRRLKNKTQVFLKPEGDHFRTRMTHTLDVCQIARSIARVLNLNEDLCEAISLAHDIGHTPFGHAGERALSRLTDGGFTHEQQGVRVVEFLENDGEGLNLTYEVKDGILNHNSNGNPKTLEGRVVHYADRIAYLNHDLDDAIRAKILREEDLPKEAIDVLGNTHGKRINTMIMSIYEKSLNQNYIIMDEKVEKATDILRQFMFQNVYLSPTKVKEESKVEELLEIVFMHYMENLDALPDFYQKRLLIDEPTRVVADYVASFTDTFALNKFKEIFLPSGLA